MYVNKRKVFRNLRAVVSITFLTISEKEKKKQHCEKNNLNWFTKLAMNIYVRHPINSDCWTIYLINAEKKYITSLYSIEFNSQRRVYFSTAL